jgi:osmotically-inducible protein OsmY
MMKRDYLAIAALLAASAGALQGCVPVVATGVAVGAALATADRRTYGVQVDDTGVEVKAEADLLQRYDDKVHVNVTSFNRNVLITGEVPDEATKAAIEQLIAGYSNVHSVTNDLRVAPPESFGSRSNDAYITSKVKARLVESGKVNANLVKVVTEAGVVYLIGMVTQQEADAATEVARTTGDVRKVVRVFQYITEEQAKKLDPPPPADAASAASTSSPRP